MATQRVPAKHWHVLVDHAARAGIAGITFASLQATKPEPAAVRAGPSPLLVWLAVGAWIAWWGAVAGEPDPNDAPSQERGRNHTR